MKKLTTMVLSLTLACSLVIAPHTATNVQAAGSGPSMNEVQAIKIERLKNYEEMKSFLNGIDKRAAHITVETIGQSVKGRDIDMVKLGVNPDNPTILFLSQQHANEPLVTEGIFYLLNKLASNSLEVQSLLKQINIIFIPRLNPDGAQGDVNWDTSHLLGGGQQTRNNANGINLNRTHNSLSQPETRALHEEVLRKHKIDFAIDMHQQVANRAIGEGDLVSGSLLYPTSTVSDEVLLNSKKLGAVVYEAIEKKGYGRLARYGTGDGLTSNARNHLATHYKVPTLLFEMRGMSDSPNISSILGQKSNGYLIRQSVDTMEATIKAVADGSIYDADETFWEDLPTQYTVEPFLSEEFGE
ncbi:M14 family zinc carboxypeptidase [Alkalihalophilus pseudofirmus]|uniref:M14 family zinc carboxypeptidase n=1 Tax=Alkalihalophilus pseudofirmus TaxID=79885 RepID=UPI00259AF684|nr:M14 family zinc carboxypeptidase [Alkalihalophilus pseudofirmus]WEG17783.1 M14 family zinc carboxypeptidase [Alkalihalophilus pseudofirmus]